MSFVKCLNPRFIVNPYTKEPMVLPCGSCDACKSLKQSLWVTRLNLEARHWKHVIFFTLTFDDEHLPKIALDTYCVDHPEVIEAAEKSPFFCKIRNYEIPYFPVDLLQKFIKRLRKSIYEHEPKKEHQILRYYVSTEYGPSTFRPHCHGLLFTNSDYFADTAQERIYKAWSDYSPTERKFTSYGRVDVQFVCSDAANYCASYSTFVSNLPTILQCKPFRPFHLCSSCPAIGSFDFTQSQIQEIFHRGLTTFSYQAPITNEVVTLPLWRSFKDRLFPKIKGFARIDSYARVVLYKLGFEWQGKSVEEIILELQFDKIWYGSYALSLIEDLFGYFTLDSKLSYRDEPFNPDSFASFVRIVKRVCVNCSIFNVTIEDYVRKIESFYSKSDYECLCNQLRAEQDFVNHVPAYPLKVLPYLIDPLFGDNSRHLSSSIYWNYRKQFGLAELENIDIKYYPQYKELFDRVTNYFSNSKKVRQKNDYLNAHPYKKLLSYTI